MNRTLLSLIAAFAPLAAQSPSPLLNDGGTALFPAISSDGRWLAYSSSRDGSAFLHLWLRPLPDGEARKLTSGSSGHSEPAFSPDGRALAYRSETNGGGVYLLPVDRGRPRLLAQGGRRPRFSPDGNLIAYWAAPSGLFLIDAAGGRPRALQTGFYSAQDPVWSPDGKSLVFAGCKDASPESCDWWVASINGGEAVATGAAGLFRQHHLSAQPSPDLWLASNAVVFTARTGEMTRLWVLSLTADPWRAGESARRLTSRETDERHPAFSPDGRVVFESRSENIDVWSLPIDSDHAKPKGALHRLTNDPSIDQRPSLSLDGRKIAWETSRGGNFEVWVKDLGSGQEKALTNGPLREHMPTLSRDGSRVVYDTHDGEKVTVFEAPFHGGDPARVVEENVGQGSFQWAADGESVLYFHRAPPGTVGLLNLSSGRRTVLLRHPRLNLSLADARLSPDGRSIAFPVPFAPHRSRLAVARLSGKVIENERDWTYLTPERFNASQPEWSPNGRWLYFLSDQTGSLAVWAMPISRENTRQGTPRLILDFPGALRTIAEMRPRDSGLSVATDKLALGVTEYGGALWSVRF
ncbi:MAG: hypothetical protein EXQ52_01130 [Bryobacterales bacterium]|nr:hypothetical protein [Bryobacterales bacterium]